MNSEIIIILLLILANGLFAMSEMAIVSARKTRLQQRAEGGDEGAKVALALADAPTRFLSTVQVGITLIGILVGAFSGATLSERLSAELARISLLEPFAEALSIVLVVLVITYFQLILGELVPKRLALTSPEGIASAVAQPMRALAFVTQPAVHLLSVSTDLIVALIGMKPTEEAVTEADISALIEQGRHAGVLLESEQTMVERVFDLDERPASLLMTPRLQMVYLSLKDPLQENFNKIISSQHSHYPLYQDEREHVIGVVSVKRLLAASIQKGTVELRDGLIEPLFVPDTAPVLDVLELFRQTGQHIALVIDEFSSIQGILTLTDVVEAIVGDLPDPGEVQEAEIVKRGDGTWLVDGMLPVVDLVDYFDLPDLPEDERYDYDTLGGFVMSRLDGIPKEGDTFDWHQYHFEVVDMDRYRVDKVLVTRKLAAENEAEAGVQE